jgi:hypothetical protein
MPNTSSTSGGSAPPIVGARSPFEELRDTFDGLASAVSDLDGVFADRGAEILRPLARDFLAVADSESHEHLSKLLDGKSSYQTEITSLKQLLDTGIRLHPDTSAFPTARERLSGLENSFDEFRQTAADVSSSEGDPYKMVLPLTRSLKLQVLRFHESPERDHCVTAVNSTIMWLSNRHSINNKLTTALGTAKQALRDIQSAIDTAANSEDTVAKKHAETALGFLDASCAEIATGLGVQWSESDGA